MAQDSNNTVEYTLKNILKDWFETGDKPNDAQFIAWFDSYWHKSEQIPTSKIAGLDALLNQAVNYKIIAGNFLIDAIQLTANNLVVGNTYYILENDFDVRDDFSNVGFENFGESFVATNANPNFWTDTIVYRLIFGVKIFQDTLVDEYTFSYNVANNSVNFQILNKLASAKNFVWSKTNAKQIDDSTIELFAFDNSYINSFELRLYNNVK